MRNPIFWLILIVVIATDNYVFNADLKAETGSNKPNIILLNLDDADTDLLSSDNINQHFPNIAELFNRSTVFTNAHCTTPFCGPSRAALMTGKYGFNNGIKTNDETSDNSNGFLGGFDRFKMFGHNEKELGIWMKQAGYRTMHVGKFHHHEFDFQEAPGWDDFSVTLGAKYFGTFRYSNINRTPATSYALDEDQYISHEELRESLAAINNHNNKRPNQPFFLYIAPFAPHAPQRNDFPTMSEPKYRNYAKGLPLPTDDPSYDESDLSDKVSFLQRRPLLESEKSQLQEFHVNRVRAVKSVDDLVAGVVKRLKQTGDWQNTYFILTSDNGFSLGQHRLMSKKDPYERGNRVPLFVTAPDSQVQKNASHLIAHLDICPTILELAGGKIPGDLDGKSFAPLIDNPQFSPPSTWQKSIMIENWSDIFVLGEWVPMAYTAERFLHTVHIAWCNGEHEYYNLRTDPFQLQSKYYRLREEARKKLNDSLLNFRKRDVAPSITIISPKLGEEVGREIPFAGFMEDNSVPVMAELVARSYTTQRYFNGRFWQNEYVSIPISPSTLTSSINTWKHDLGIFSETTSEFDIFVSWVVPVDDSMKRGPLKYTYNPSFNNSLYAKINPTIHGSTFNGATQSLVGYHGKHPNQSVRLSIVDQTTQKYFNGNGFQRQNFGLIADSLPDHRWSRTVRLPPGNYKCFVHGFSGNLYQSEAESAQFIVK